MRSLISFTSTTFFCQALLQLLSRSDKLKGRGHLPQVAQSLPLATSHKNRRPDVKYRHSAEIFVASKRKAISFLFLNFFFFFLKNLRPTFRRSVERNAFNLLSAKVLTELKVVTNGHHRHIRLLTATKQQSATISRKWLQS